MNSPVLIDLHPTLLDFEQEVLRGLAQTPKTFPPQFLFHDAKGSDLFNQICATEEYYVTRTEIDLLHTYAADIAQLIGQDALLIEYGSGSVEKVYPLLNALGSLAAYAPIDIAQDHLSSYVMKTAAAYPHVPIAGIRGDFTGHLELPDELQAIENKVILFTGSTIGNFDREQAIKLLQQSAQLLHHQGHMLIGVDLKKDPNRLHCAYNDSLQITAAFNYNILANINRELDANFDPDQFYHYAPYNPFLGRIEMHLISKCPQWVTVAGQEFFFRAGETLHTENSHKYSIEDFKALVMAAGLTLEQTWIDPGSLFSLHWVNLGPARDNA